MPNRLIREGWLDSEAIDKLSPDAERFFLRLCLAADDAGRFDGRRDILRSRLFPLKFGLRTNDVEKLLQQCVGEDLVMSYEWAGKPFVQLSKFQKTGPSKWSKFPDPYGVFDIKYVKISTRDGEKEFVSSSMWGGADAMTGGQPIRNPESYGILKPSGTHTEPIGGVLRALYPESESESESETLGKPEAGRPVPAAASTEDWLTGLEADPTYMGINVRHSYGKMLRWCTENHKKPTRRRFINWLNREEPPLHLVSARRVGELEAPKPKYEESAS